MEIQIISFTKAGTKLASTLKENLLKREYQVECSNVKADVLQELVRVFFEKKGERALVFIGAAGIAVRSIAPYLVNKWQDPAVLVLDEKGMYVIPILSGHFGGANALARQIAEDIQGQAVLTTASDVNHKLALDVWAKEQDLMIMDVDAMKRMAVLNLEEKAIAVWIECSDALKNEIDTKPLQLATNIEIVEMKDIQLREQKAGSEYIGNEYEGIIYIGYHPNPIPQKTYLWFLPRTLALGIGCKKGTTKKQIVCAIENAFMKLGYETTPWAAVTGMYSIDLKKEEIGMKEVSVENQIPFICFSKEELNQVEGTFHKSEFVESVTGVDCICERAAVCGNPGSFLLLEKYAQDGVTIAISAQ